MNLIFYVLGLTLILELLLAIGLLISLMYPKHRLWPPPKKGSWQYWYIHSITESSILCFLVLGFIDWNTFFLTHWARFAIAFSMMIPGTTIFLWALNTLKLKTSLGSRGKIITQGPYRYSRNPQYIGFALFLLGAIFFFNSLSATITGWIGIILFLFTPFVEESWLKDQFQEEYHNYCKKVPRFI